MVIGDQPAKQQEQRRTQSNPSDKGLLHRTLDKLAKNQYLACGSIRNVLDEESDQTTNQSDNSRYGNLLRCGIQTTGFSEDEIDYEIDEKDFDDILLKTNSFANGENTFHSIQNNHQNAPKRGKLKIRKSPTQQQQTRNISLYRKTMMTAANANEVQGDESNANTNAPDPMQALQKTARFARGFADDAGRAIGNLLPTASLQNLTARKYTLPDKTVASQVLMYRQLLHTKCRPGLKLSRPYQETPAQIAVLHMPWWEQGIEESRKMIISYDNLITRLWLNGAIEPFQTSDDAAETFITEEGLPPIPHQFWVDRLGFQQPDPVTDFRSGGVLSLAMMVYMVESKPEICRRFFLGDTKVLPFGITCINVTDMIAKFLMLAKSTDRMDALLSQKPFWKMFADPNAITAVQELAMSMLCDVASEVGEEKKIPHLNQSDGMGDARTEVRIDSTCMFVIWMAVLCNSQVFLLNLANRHILLSFFDR